MRVLILYKTMKKMVNLEYYDFIWHHYCHSELDFPDLRFGLGMGMRLSLDLTSCELFDLDLCLGLWISPGPEIGALPGLGSESYLNSPYRTSSIRPKVPKHHFQTFE